MSNWYPTYNKHKKISKLCQSQGDAIGAVNSRQKADAAYKGSSYNDPNGTRHKEWMGYSQGHADNQRGPNYWHLGSAIAPDNRPFMQQYHGGKRVGNTQFIVPSHW
eukprot:99250_1